MPPRKPAISPHFDTYLQGLRAGQPLELALTGHLVIEALLVEVIQLKRPGNKTWKLNFPKKVEAAIDEGLLDAGRKDVYLRLNDLRNDFAHILGHELRYDELFGLVGLMASLGYDFSDDTIHQNRALSEEWYGFEGALTEVLNELYSELAWILHDNGGPDRLG